MRAMGLAALCAALLLAGCAPRSRPDAPSVPPEPAPVEPAVERPAQAERDAPAKAAPPPADPAAFVRVRDYLPGVCVDLRYATADNFTGQVIYDFTDAYLRYGTVEKLRAAQDALSEQGYALLLWDAFRPVDAQFRLWEACPDPAYVADPTRGHSSHSRGNTVDVTLAAADGAPVEMPTGFDDFTTLADRDYSDVPEPAASNARLLEDVMTASGFQPYAGEWWHFSDSDVYPVEEAFAP